MRPRWHCSISTYTFIWSENPRSGFMTGADREAKDPRETGTQLRPGLWHTINERYPGSMIEKSDFVPLAPCRKPLSEARLTLISSCGVHARVILLSTSVTRSATFGSGAFRHRAARRFNHPSTEVSARRCRPGHQRDLSDRTLAGVGRRGCARRPYGEFLQLHRLQHGPREIRAHGRAWDRRRGCARRSKPMPLCWSLLDRSAISPSD